MEEQRGGLFLKKKDVAVDYLGKQPSNLTTCCLPEKNVKGYLANGMLDTTMRVLPVLQTIVASCKTAPKAHHYRMIITQFPMLMGYSYDHRMRYIGDNYLVSLGFPVSVDAYGDE